MLGCVKKNNTKKQRGLMLPFTEGQKSVIPIMEGAASFHWFSLDEI